VSIPNTTARRLTPLASISFRDDEPVFGPGHALLDGVASPNADNLALIHR